MGAEEFSAWDTAEIRLSPYVLESLRKDDEFILYRGRAESGAPRILALATLSQQPTPATIGKLEHAYSLKTQLDAEWAVRPVALTQYEGRTMLVLEDPGGEPLDTLLARPMELTQFLRVGIGLSSALGKLHARGLIHKDIKPGNVLVLCATSRVWLMGFGIASQRPRERQAPEPPEFVAGTLPHMAPEQTGRMNRSIDSRTDLYGLGVTLYEMLTGALPFTACDPMEWVHCHIARQPAAPFERLKDIPTSVSEIMIKLLAKTAEQRYQTAAGVENDLRRCLMEWETQHRIEEFPLGEHDVPDRLLISENLYGRAREIESLLASFDRVVKSGTPELVLVSGSSGIGKSAVIYELHKVLVPSRGLFASGKFDQYNRDIPYAALAEAFQSLIRPLLRKSEAELSNWRDAICEALGPTGLLITDLVPEVKLMIGEQPPVPQLQPQDAQRRFHLVFRRFISVFARPEHPLALFLDDLQWLDAATLDVLEDLLVQPDVHYLLLIGAYRDDEVDSVHPLIRKLDAIRTAGAMVNEITVTPLAREDLERFIADSLRCEPQDVRELAQLVHEKAAGNPFFVIQFLYALAEEALLIFDRGKARWSWDLNRIRTKGYTDNVVELIVRNIQRLPEKTQEALQCLACLGHIAAISTLSLICGTTEEEVRRYMWDAVRQGLIEPLEGSYRFVHDRVQETAYSLILKESAAEAHLRIGRLLAAHIPPEKRDEAIFEMVNQLNRGAALITSQDEREQLANLNLIAGKRAKSSAAYASALHYLNAGAALLGEDRWERQHELTFQLELHRAECEFLTGELAATEELLAGLSTQAANTLERASVAALRMNLYTTLNQNDRTVDVGLEYLRGVGVSWSPHPTKEEVLREYERLSQQLGSRPIEAIADLPKMIDPDLCATFGVLMALQPSAVVTDRNLYSLVVGRMANLSLENGNHDASCLAYVWVGMVIATELGDYDAGFRFGKMGLDLVEKHGLDRFKARGRWGAESKVRQFAALYPRLTQEMAAPGPATTMETPVEHLDLASVVKVSQAVSGEIVLEKLIDTLMRGAIEQTGAERGLLILPRGAELRIYAEGNSGAEGNTGGSQVNIGLRDAPISSRELPESVVQYAARTQESVVLEDAASRGSFASDEYIRRNYARSILCLPLVKQGRLVGVLYLENNLAANVFNPTRTAVLKVLASEAATSLENSRLCRELLEGEAKIRRLVDANLVGVVISQPGGQILEANEAFLEMLGFSREDLMAGRLRWTDLTPPEWQAVSEQANAQIRATGRCDAYEKEYVRKDGSRVPVMVGGAMLGDSQSEAVGFVLDLSERKRAEQEREKLRADVAYMSRITMMGELAGSLAHEIKQPIAAAVTNANACVRWLQRDVPDVTEACEAAARMVSDAKRAADIIDRVRSLYRRSTPQRVLIDVNEIIREMIALLHYEANRHSIGIRAELAETLPQVMADRVQVQQVLLNLMLNGVEAMKDAAGELVIKSQQTEDRQLLISVSDSGVGIPSEHINRIFDAFFTTKQHGTGMGLAISRTIIESHGGRLWATANTGGGATFQFTLPVETNVFEMPRV
jgi:PAS domain S-box-containing protein